MNEISMTEAAQILNVSKTQVYRLVQSGRLSARKIGYQWVIETASVEKYAKERRPTKK